MSFRSIRVHAKDGCAIHAEVWGEAPAEVLFVHGFGDGAFVWQDVLRRLAPLRCVAVDLRGHGASGWDPLGAYEIDTHASDVECVIRELRLDHVAIVGHSLGSAVALRLAARVPGVRGLVMVDGGPDLSRIAVRHVREAFRAQPWRYSSMKDYLATLEMRFPLADAATLQEFAAGALRITPDGVAELRCDPALADSPERDESALLWQLLKATPCPVLVIRGARSAVLDREAVLKTQRELPYVRARTVAAAGAYDHAR